MEAGAFQYAIKSKTSQLLERLYPEPESNRHGLAPTGGPAFDNRHQIKKRE
jgi:hypothetical protein